MADDEKKDHKQAPGLSIRTLLISSASAVAAATLVPLVWEKGTLIATALTPVVVAIVSNLLEKPINKVASARVLRHDGEDGAGSDDGATEHPAVLIVAEGTDPLPEEEPTLILPSGVDLEETTRPLEEPDEQAGWRERIAANLPKFRGRRARIVLATGLLGFVLGGTLITVSELVGGGSISLNKRTTLLPGSVDTSDLEDEPEAPAPTPTATATPSATASPTETASPQDTAEPDDSPSPTRTPADDDDEDATDRASPTPTRTATPEATPTATASPTASPTPAP